MNYYLTTPIYYVNAAPHIGHAYTTIAADAIRRLRRMQGIHAVLTTGTDEHGQKIERAAEAANKTPQEFTDVISAEFRRAWETLGLEIDHFQRTTSAQHAAVVQDLFRRCKENGYIYKGSYSGAYCVSDELYANEAKPGDPCPLCGRELELVTEENYYFKLSEFTDWLIELNSGPDFLQPEARRNEVLAFLRQPGGLKDLSISRTTIKWGIPVPGDEAHVFYVWFDALSTYMSAVEGTELWPADLHLIGKEIVRFHAIYWPAFLKAAGLPLPKRVFAHGWLLFNNEKMSKSKGNLVRATPIVEALGADALRYYLLRDIPFGSDGSFSYDALVQRYNSDLANGLGNLASRTLTMIRQYRGGVIPQGGEIEHPDPRPAVDDYENFAFHAALTRVAELVSWADGFIVQQAPWKLAKDPNGAPQLDATLYHAAECLRIATALYYPVIPDSARRIWQQLGMTEPIESIRIQELQWGQLEPGQRIGEVGPVFPRAELEATIAKLWEREEAEKQRQSALFAKPRPAVAPLEPEITIDDFVKVDLRVGQVLEAANVKGADKLLHLKVDLGEAQPRSIVAGIAKAYKPEQLIGRKVVIVANLAPRKLRGLESQGMIVAASLPDGPPVLAAFLEDIEPGARLK